MYRINYTNFPEHEIMKRTISHSSPHSHGQIEDSISFEELICELGLLRTSLTDEQRETVSDYFLFK